MADDTTPRERAVRALAANEQGDAAAHDSCGPEPERPTYFSPQAVRDRYYAWKTCKSGA
jgi:hypothetical protein